jgi:D-glycerate 3-kinase
VKPVNELESKEDAQGRWRRYVNAALERDYLPLYRRVDWWVMLQAPSFACVKRWRLEQEQKLASKTAGRGEGLMNAAQLSRFIQHYQRLTETCLAQLPPRVDYLYQLDAQRQVTASRIEGRVVT